MGRNRASLSLDLDPVHCRTTELISFIGVICIVLRVLFRVGIQNARRNNNNTQNQFAAKVRSD